MKKLNEKAVKAWAGLLRFQKHALDKVEKDLKSADLPPLAWYDVLLELHRREGGLRQYEIGERILLSKHNLSRLLDRLEKQQLIRRTACTEDGRGSVVQITAMGRQMRERMWPVYAGAIQSQFASRLSQDEMTVFASTLAKLLD